jgi:hypothetical protein
MVIRQRQVEGPEVLGHHSPAALSVLVVFGMALVVVRVLLPLRPRAVWAGQRPTVAGAGGGRRGLLEGAEQIADSAGWVVGRSSLV